MNPFKENSDPKVKSLFQFPDFDEDEVEDFDMRSIFASKKKQSVQRQNVLSENSVQKEQIRTQANRIKVTQTQQISLPSKQKIKSLVLTIENRKIPQENEAWNCMYDFITNKEMLKLYNIEIIQSGKYDNNKIPFLTVQIIDFDPIGDTISSTFKDLTGTMKGSLCQKIFSNNQQLNSAQPKLCTIKFEERIPLRTPLVMQLKDVTIFAPNDDERFLLINEQNIVYCTTYC